MSQTIQNLNYKIKVTINGRNVERPVYLVKGKKCIIKIVDKKREYIPLEKYNTKTKQKGGEREGDLDVDYSQVVIKNDIEASVDYIIQYKLKNMTVHGWVVSVVDDKSSFLKAEKTPMSVVLDVPNMKKFLFTMVIKEKSVGGGIRR